MNVKHEKYDVIKCCLFPSPTGVNYYEFKNGFGYRLARIQLKFPPPTGVNHYEYVAPYDNYVQYTNTFPSPTGVNHYEL